MTTTERQHLRTFVALSKNSTKPQVEGAKRAIATDNKAGLFSLASSPVGTEIAAIYNLYGQLLQGANGRYQVKAIAQKTLVEQVKEVLKPSKKSLSGVEENQSTVILEGLDATAIDQTLRALVANATPYRYVKYSVGAFYREFGTNGEVTTPIGTVVINFDQFDKIEEKQRKQYFGLIKPTLEQPQLVLKHHNRDLFIKVFVNLQNRGVYFVSVVKDEDGHLQVVSNHEKAERSIRNKVREGTIIYPTDSLLTALSGSTDHHPENYHALTIGIPLLYLGTKVQQSSESPLSGTVILEGLDTEALEKCTPCQNKPLHGLPPLMRADEVEGISYPLLDLAHTKFADLLGEIADNASLMIWGNPGQGKSTFSLQIARSLASKGIRTLYVSNEEYASMTLAERLKRLGGAVDNLYFAKDAKQVNPTYKVVLIDSTNSMMFSLEEFRGLRIRYPHIAFILIMQATKGGQFKGVKEWEHEVDIVVEITQGMAKTTKNRFAMLNEVEVFD